MQMEEISNSWFSRKAFWGLPLKQDTWGKAEAQFDPMEKLNGNPGPA